MTYYDQRNAGGYGLRPLKRYRSARLANNVALAPATRVAVDREIRRIKRKDADKISIQENNDSGGGTAQTAVTWLGAMRSVYGNAGQGDGSINQFNGEGFEPLSLRVRWQWEVDIDEGDYSTVRIIIIQYFAEGSAAVAGPSTFLGNVAGANAALSYFDWDNRKTYKVLADTGPMTMLHDFGSGSPPIQSGVLYVPGRKMRKTWFKNDGTLQKNDISIIMISDSNSASSNHPLVRWTSQLIGTDNS